MIKYWIPKSRIIEDRLRDAEDELNQSHQTNWVRRDNWGMSPDVPEWGKTSVQQQAQREGRLIDASSIGQLGVGLAANKFNYVGGPQQWEDWQTQGFNLPTGQRVDLKGLADVGLSAATDPLTYIGAPFAKVGAKQVVKGAGKLAQEAKPVLKEIATSEVGAVGKVPKKAIPPDAIEQEILAKRAKIAPGLKSEPLSGESGGIPPTPPKPAAVGDFESAKNKFISVMNEAQKAIKETELLRKPERAERFAKFEAGLQERQGRESVVKASGALKGKYSEAGFAPINEKFVPNEYKELQNAIIDAGISRKIKPIEVKPASDALDALFLEGTRPRQFELDLFRDVFGEEFANAIKSASRSDKFWRNFVDTINAPRAVLSSYDLSASLRQGGILTARNPILGAKTTGIQARALFSEKYATLVDDMIRSDPMFGKAYDAGLYIAPRSGSKLWQREESFMSRFAEKIPGVKQSERAYITGLNYLRFNSFKKVASTFEKVGATQNDYDELAKLINFASGRGSLPKVAQGSAPILNAILFSPRLIISRLQLPTMLLSSSPLVRKEAAKQLVLFLGAGATVLSLMKLAGAEVELDPRSSDFGKAKIGNTRLDFWTGYAQYARFADQLASAQRKTTDTGNTVELNRKEVVDRFLQSKLSPGAGLLNDILQGQTYSGEEMTLDTQSAKQQAYNRLTPLFIQDMIDAIEADGKTGGALASSGAFGIGVVSYPPKQAEIDIPLPSKRRRKTLPIP